ncbi:MAG: hypothetical protein KAI95_07760, partial [Bacteroidales bacterium]|nr:hypothetical protein [Bacteroidales bacterium]
MKTIRYQNIIGFRKNLVNTRIKLVTLLYFLGQLFKGEFMARNFPRVLRRLLFFLFAFKENKYVKIGRNIKINLYV